MALCEIRVHVLSARDIKPNGPSQTFHKAVVTLPGLTRVSHTSKLSERPNDPRWNQVFTFNVPTARLTPEKTVQVKIFESSDVFCGQASVPLWGLKDPEPHRYVVSDEAGKQRGVIKVGVKVTPVDGPSSPEARSPPKKEEEKAAKPKAGVTIQRPQTSQGTKIVYPEQQQQQQQPNRPGLTIVTLESEMKNMKAGNKLATASSASSSKSRQPKQPQPIGVTGRAHSVTAGSVPPKGQPGVYVQPAAPPSMGYPHPAPYPPHPGHPPPGYPSAPPPGYPGAPPPGYPPHPAAGYPPPPPGGYPPPMVTPMPPPMVARSGPPAPYPYGSYGVSGPSMAFGGPGGSVKMAHSRPNGRGGMMSDAAGMMAGAAVGAGLGILGGMALEEALDDDDDEDDFF